MIDTAMQRNLYAFLKNRVIETRGAYFHAIGGIEDHVHLACSVKPSIHPDEWIGQLKGASSYEIGKSLQWQSGYGIVSYGTRDLPWVRNYVLNQREHHAKGSVFARLEKVEDAEDSAAWDG